jgi:hypothetical protein
VYDIDIDLNNHLIAATHGRGMWLTDIVLSAESTKPALQDFALMQNYPNPSQAASGTMLSFTLKQASDVTLKLYDASGRMLRTLVDNRRAAGTHNVNLNTADLLSGVYFYTLSSDAKTVTKKLVVL